MSKIDLRELINEYFKTKEDSVKEQILVFAQETPLKDFSDVYFKDLVETKGPSITIAGELIRASNRIAYLWLNNNDIYFAGYGLDKVGSDAIFISESTNEILSRMITQTFPEQYLLSGDRAATANNFVKTLETRVGQFIKLNPTTLLIRNTVDSAKDFKDQAIKVFEEYDDIINSDEDFN